MTDIFANAEIGLTMPSLAEFVHIHQINMLSDYIKNRDNQIPPPSIPMLSSPLNDFNVDPTLQTSSSNNAASQQKPPVVVPNRYNILTAGGADEYLRSLDFGGEKFEGSEYVYFQLPPEVVNVWPWNFDISRGFGGSN